MGREGGRRVRYIIHKSKSLKYFTGSFLSFKVGPD